MFFQLKLMISASGSYRSEKVTAAGATRRHSSFASHVDLNEATTAKCYQY